MLRLAIFLASFASVNADRVCMYDCGYMTYKPAGYAEAHEANNCAVGDLQCPLGLQYSQTWERFRLDADGAKTYVGDAVEQQYSSQTRRKGSRFKVLAINESVRVF
jgi:hypothetical protein